MTVTNKCRFNISDGKALTLRMYLGQGRLLECVHFGKLQSGSGRASTGLFDIQVAIGLACGIPDHACARKHLC